MRFRAISCVAILCLIFVGTSFATPVHLRCDNLQNPLGIDNPVPQLSWFSDNQERNWEQAFYQILVASSAEQLHGGNADIWDSEKVKSGDSVGIRYAGAKLESRRRYYWKVRVWSSRGEMSESNEAATWEMGLLHRTDWKAQWITWKNPAAEADRLGVHWLWVTGQNALDVAPKTTAVFQTKFSLKDKPQDGALLIVARGRYVATVNGHEVGRKGGWSAFDRRDITEQLVIGENTIELKLTSMASPTFWPGKDGKSSIAGVAALVKITLPNGTIQRQATDEKWKARLESEAKWDAPQVVGDLSDKRMGDPGYIPEAAAYLRKNLVLVAKVKSARLFVTALGSYRFFVNGQRVGRDVLTPEFTDYRKRVLYQAYDVTSSLVQGKNSLAALLGNGWYGSGLTWIGMHFFAPPELLIAQLEVDYANGRHETFVSDKSWKGSASPVLLSEVYAGEVYDARREQKGWEAAGFDDSKWTAATVANAPAIEVSSQITVPAQVVMTLSPKSVTQTPDGVYIFDMGQNMVGWANLKVSGLAGSRVRMRFAEILKPDGSIYTDNLRNADATDLYILKGGGEETFTPHFTFHGFRYVELTGYPGKPVTSALTGEVVSSVNGDPTGKLTTSSDLVNRMWSIGIWGQRGNFLSIPTDCPQRDERLGWMGDAGVFWRTGSYNFDISAFSQKFIQDIVDAQGTDGGYTNVSPNTMPAEGNGPDRMVGAPGWGDAGVIVPYTTWLQYGNSDVIVRNWDSMQRWMEFIQSRNPDFIRKKGVGPNFADWLAPDTHTDKDLLATAYWALIANMMSEMAHAVGKESDAKRYAGVVASIRNAFQKAYITGDGVVGTGTQTSYVVALYTKMAPTALEPALVTNLVKDIEARGWHLSTGFLGTPFLLFTLSDHGRSDVAYRLLLNDTYPSWGYMLSKGATTWWERWNGDTGDPAMNSYNHYAFGSVVAWVYRYVAGIDTSLTGPGFKRIVIHPHLDARMTASKGEYDSAYGKVSTDWTNEPAGAFKLSVRIPANTTADVYLPAKSNSHVYEGGNEMHGDVVDSEFVVHLGSGDYAFEVR